nr:hypothetical protein GCM10020092_025550 [Actinoplanes digitatis]
MHYQPIVDLNTGGIIAAEALLRWTRPDGTPVSPAQFIPLAEQSGEITIIGDWVLDQVCADLASLWSAHRVPVTVNVSAHQLRDAGFADRVLNRLRSADLPGQSLIVEITETVLITTVTDAANTIAQLQQLRDHGVRIAIDDFGTGYSSLAYLRELPVDILKMDGSFTSHQIEDGSPREIAFVRTIVALGRSLNLVTLAEAVETPGQAERLRRIGCHLAQGYHFARLSPDRHPARVAHRRTTRHPRNGCVTTDATTARSGSAQSAAAAPPARGQQIVTQRLVQVLAGESFYKLGPAPSDPRWSSGTSCRALHP